MGIRDTVLDMAAALDLPPESAGAALRVTVTGARRAVVEYHKGLLGYSESAVEVSGGRERLRILGGELLLRAMDRETLIVTGRIASVEFI